MVHILQILLRSPQKPVMRNIDKRLGNQLASLRQILWRQRGSAKPDRRLLEDRPIEYIEYTDTCRWIDIAAMVAD